jgi:hypothetical protein
MGISPFSRWLALGCAIAFVACGGAQREPAQPESAGEPPPAQPGYGQPAPPPPADSEATESEEPSSLEGDERAITTVEEGERALAEGRDELDRLLAQPAATTSDAACRRVCAALGSMRRSAEAICQLAGEDEPRCENARKLLDDSTHRVQGAGCACQR